LEACEASWRDRSLQRNPIAPATEKTTDMSNVETLDDQTQRQAVPDGQAQDQAAAALNGTAHDLVAQLRDFLEIDDSSKQYARVLRALFAAHSDAIVDEFYRKVQKSAIGAHVSNDAIERLKPKQKAHWETLFNSDFGPGYAQSVRCIGIRHRDIELSPSWYVAGYVKLKIEFIEWIAMLDVPAEKKIGLVTTLEKYVAIDMALALASYDSVILD
jgi:hypothetical protein